MGIEKPNKQIIPYQINITLLEKNDQPMIRIRKETTDLQTIKTIISCAFHQRPITIQPTFNNKIKALATLQHRGIIYRKNGEYHYTI